MRDDVVRLRSLEKRFIVEETRAVLRHDLRNKLAAIRNASFYLRRKVESSAAALWREERRVPEFFELIDAELTAAEAILGATFPISSGDDIRHGVAPMAEIFKVAIEVVARADVSIQVRDHVAMKAPGNRDELTVAIVVLVEAAIEAGARAITIDCVRREDGSTALELSAEDGVGFGSGTALGPRIARRIAVRCGGKFDLGRSNGRDNVVTLSFAAVEKR